MNSIELDNYSLHVINFESIFTRAYKCIVDDLFTYDKFHDHNVRSQDTKRIYYYHLIKTICDVVIETRTTNKIVIYYCDKDIKCDFKSCTQLRQTVYSCKHRLYAFTRTQSTTDMKWSGKGRDVPNIFEQGGHFRNILAM